MSTDPIQLRLAIRNAVNAQAKAQSDYELKLLELEKWKKRYKLALEKGRDDLASAARFQVERLLVLSKSVKSAIDQQEPHIEKLRKQLSSLEENILLELSKENPEPFRESLLLEPSKPELRSIAIDDGANLDDLIARLATLEDSEVLNSEDELVQIDAEIIDEDTRSQVFSNFTSEDSLSLSKDYLIFQLSEIINDVEKAISNTPDYREHLQTQYRLAWEKVNQYHDEANNALKRDSDIETIEALISKQVYKKLALALKEQLEQQSTRIDVIKRILARLNVAERTLRVL